jgi:hypothetical protein
MFIHFNEVLAAIYVDPVSKSAANFCAEVKVHHLNAPECI